MRRQLDLVDLVAGLAFAITSVWFLVVDDPSLHDVATALTPLVLLGAGFALLVGSIVRRSRADDELLD